MQVDVGQQGGHDSALRSTAVGAMKFGSSGKCRGEW
jgi:hypothetical protein